MGDLTAVWADIEGSIEQSGTCLQKMLVCNHQVQEALLAWQTRDRLQAALKSCREVIKMSEELARAYAPAMDAEAAGQAQQLAQQAQVQQQQQHPPQ